MPESEFETRLNILMREWDHTQSHIGRYDTILFQIRTWAVTVFTGLIVVSASQGKPELMLLGIPVIAIFWIVDGFHKGFQMIFMARAEVIEDYLSSNKFFDDLRDQAFERFKFPGLANEFRELRYRAKSTRFVEIMTASFNRNVVFLYGSMFVVCVVAYVVLQSLGSR